MYDITGSGMHCARELTVILRYETKGRTSRKVIICRTGNEITIAGHAAAEL